MTDNLGSIPDELVADYIDGEMTYEERELLEQVLAQDIRLQKYVAEVRRGRNLLRSLPDRKFPKNKSPYLSHRFSCVFCSANEQN